MRKLTFLTFVITVTTVLNFSVMTRNTARTSQQIAALTINGASNPDVIPDWVANEFFFRSLVTSPSEGDKGQRRIEAFARQVGLQDSQIDALLSEAKGFYREINAFDRRVRAIKDQTWPDPPADVWVRLRDIQKQKEAAIIEGSNAILARRGAEAGTKLAQFINDYVKRRVKGYAAKPMVGQSSRSHHTRSLETVSPFLAGTMQMQGDETVYIYSNTVYSSPDPYICGYGDVRATAGSYGRDYSPRIEMHGPGSGQSSSTNGSQSSLDLCLLDDCFDGIFTTMVVAVVSSPILNNTFDNGSNSSSTRVGAFIRVNPLGAFSQGTISGSSQSTAAISFSITASRGANVTGGIEPSYILTNGEAPVHIYSSVATGDDFSISAGQTIPCTLLYRSIQITTNPTRIKAEALVTANVGVINSNPISTSKLTITP